MNYQYTYDKMDNIVTKNADFGLNLFQQVFAGCRQSLLASGS
jgi:hypothetical protein